MYYIIEHPTRGVLFDTDETDSGKVGRFSPTKPRTDAVRFPTPEKAAKFRERITSANPEDCMIMKSPLFDQPRWTRVLMGPVEEPRPGALRTARELRRHGYS